jgi:hypothetical protein
LAKLKHGTWLGNIIIDFFIWKLLAMIVKIGMKDVYKRFKIMDINFMYYMFVQLGRYDFDSCRRWVTKREVNADGHVFSFMSHELILVPVNMENVCLFVIFPANREIIAIDSLYDPRSQYHINIYHHLVQFIQDYQKKSLQQDEWAWHMKPITVKQQANQDDCGVCMSLEMYGNVLFSGWTPEQSLHTYSMIRLVFSCFILEWAITSILMKTKPKMWMREEEVLASWKIRRLMYTTIMTVTVMNANNDFRTKQIHLLWSKHS